MYAKKFGVFGAETGEMNMKEYNVLQYGAAGDGKTNDAFAIQHAIDDCAKSGGGTVVLQSGSVFYSDSVRLKSNVNLHIQKGAVLKATSNIDGYIRPNKLINDPKTALIGNPVTGKPSFVFIYGFEADNCTIRAQLMQTATPLCSARINIMLPVSFIPAQR